MTPERWEHVKAIFNSAIQHLPEERDSFLSEACSGDLSLRSEVESLIAAHEKSGEFIDEPAYQGAAWLGGEKSELKAGQPIGSYRVVSFISRGGMGEVYLAEDQRLNRRVALKLLPASFKDNERLRRFAQEARAASALNHPNIITIHDIQEFASTHVIVTEFVEGETLRERLSRSLLSLSEALNIAIQVADALSAAHRAGIIHRDIKPENIMIRPDGYVKVLDFGLAKLIEAPIPLSSAEVPTRRVATGSGVIIGTIGYMSPEQARAQKIDARSDIFSLGAMLYEMVAGQKPFVGESSSDVLAAILKIDAPPVSHYRPEAPAELVRIINKTLRKDREERYQVVKDLLLDLKSLKEEIDFEAKRDRSVAPSKAQATDANNQLHLTTAETHDETSEIKTAISTITHSLSVEIKRHKTGAILTLIAITLATSVGVIALYKVLNRSQTETSGKPEVLQTTQITFSTGFDGSPSLSPDGKSVVYSSDQNGSFELYIKQLTPGGGELQLTNDGKKNFHPAWSPDGQRIAYCPGDRRGIWLISALGGTPKQLTEFGSRPAWSPDGSTIAFESAATGEVFSTQVMPPSTIWIVPSQGGEPRQISQAGNPSGGHSAPSWSPDGKRVVFQNSDYLVTSAWSVGVDGSGVKKIAEGASPIYAHDGEHIYFVSRGGLSRVQVSSSGELLGEPVVVVAPVPGTWLVSPAISADGKKIIYSAFRVQSSLWSVPLSPTSAESAGPPALFEQDTSQRHNLGRFSPDGRKIAMNKWRPGMSADVWVADEDGRNLIQVTNNPATDSQASWFPDGDKLAFLSDRSNHMMLWTVSLATRKEEPFLDLGEEIQYVQLSPDAKQVAFNSIQKGIMNVWIADVKTGQRRQLTFDDQLMGFPSWSPDGQFIASESQRGDDAYLMVIPSGGGEATQLTFERGKSWPYSWSHDGDKIAFAGQRNGIWNIYWVSRSTKVQKQLTNYSKLNAFVRYPAWSPRGNQIVYEYADITGNIWTVELK